MLRVSLAVLLSAAFAGGCDRIPGTTAHRIANGERVAADALIDPSSAQFRKTILRPRPKDEGEKSDGPQWVVCGEINGKNRNGAYVGFGRFIADPNPDGDGAYLEPMSTTSTEEVDRAIDQCERGARGPIYSETDRDIRLMTCERARDLAEERMEVARFNMTWEALCEGESASEPVNTPTGAQS